MRLKIQQCLYTSVVVLASCRSNIKSPEQCQGFKQTSIALAKVVWEKDVKPYPHTTESEALKYCWYDVENNGYSFAKKPGGLGWFDRFTTTVPGQGGKGTIFLSTEFDDQSELSQAATICHERVHMYTEKRIGLEASAVTYAIWEGVLGFDLPAYGVTLLHKKEAGATPQQLEDASRHIAAGLASSYLRGKVSEDCVLETATAFWREVSVLP